MIQPLENGRGVPIGDLLPRGVRYDLIYLRNALRADERAALEELLEILHLRNDERPLVSGPSLRVAGQKMRGW